MKYRKTFILLGLLTALLPFIGFPLPWKTVLYVIIGILIMLLSFVGDGSVKNMNYGDEREEINSS